MLSLSLIIDRFARNGIHSCNGSGSCCQFHCTCMPRWSISILWLLTKLTSASTAQRLDMGWLRWWFRIWLQVSNIHPVRSATVIDSAQRENNIIFYVHLLMQSINLFSRRWPFICHKKIANAFAVYSCSWLVLFIFVILVVESHGRKQILRVFFCDEWIKHTLRDFTKAIWYFGSQTQGIFLL